MTDAPQIPLRVELKFEVIGVNHYVEYKCGGCRQNTFDVMYHAKMHDADIVSIIGAKFYAKEPGKR